VVGKNIIIQQSLGLNHTLGIQDLGGIGEHGLVMVLTMQMKLFLKQK
jgi:hypothetical protein